jgi:hypothetical protein
VRQGETTRVPPEKRSRPIGAEERAPRAPVGRDDEDEDDAGWIEDEGEAAHTGERGRG